MKTYILLILSFFMILTSCSNETTTPNNSVSTEITQNLIQPERKLDIYGKITAMEGNEITLLQVDTSKDPTFNMTTEEKKKYMQSMDEATRMALKEEINNANLGEVKLIIPVGIPMTKKESEGPDAPVLEASIADLKVGSFISVWLNTEVQEQKIAEFVKIAFTK